MLADRVRMGSGFGEDDIWGTPGKLKLIGGDMSAGFFGEVPSSQFITGDSLISLVGLPSHIGTSHNSNEPWLKFAYNNKIQFVTKKTIRYNVGRHSLDYLDYVFGNKIITVKGFSFKLRLMQGLSGSSAQNSEWNKLMLPIHIEAKNKAWGNPSNVESNVPYWGIDYTNDDLGTLSNAGCQSWCQEVSGSNAIFRGYPNGVTGMLWIANDSVHNYRGWRPVLELVA